DQPAARDPLDRIHVLRIEQPSAGTGRGYQPVRSVDLEVPALESGVRLPYGSRHLLRMQRRHVIVLLEGVREYLPVAVVVGDEIVTLGHHFERIVVERGDHRAEELAQALPWFWVEVDEDEAVPDVAVDRAQPVLSGVEVEELTGLLHERQ